MKKIVLIIYDFDGVMTNNRVLLFEGGREAVFVNRSDGLAGWIIQQVNGFKPAVSCKDLISNAQFGINYGIESLDEKALRVMNKALTVKQITGGIENTLACGISPGFNIILAISTKR